MGVQYVYTYILQLFDNSFVINIVYNSFVLILQDSKSSVIKPLNDHENIYSLNF